MLPVLPVLIFPPRVALAIALRVFHMPVEILAGAASASFPTDTLSSSRPWSLEGGYARCHVSLSFNDELRTLRSSDP